MNIDTIYLLVGVNGFVLAAIMATAWFFMPATDGPSVVVEENPVGLQGVITELFKDAIARTVKVASLEKVAYRLDLAGNPKGWNVERIFAAKVFSAFGFFTVSLVFGSAVIDLTSLKGLLFMAGVTTFGFFLPTILLYNAGVKRQAKIQKTLPDVLDLTSVSMQAGLGFDAAMAKVADNGSGPLVDEFSRMLNEFRAGQSRADVLRGLLDRTNVADLRHVIQALIQAGSLGIPVAAVLTEQGKEMRVKRRQRAEEKAQKITIKILFPTLFCIFPALIVVVIGPGAIGIMEAFKAW